MTTISRPLAIFFGALALTITAQETTLKAPPFGSVTLPNTDALYQQLLRSNVEGIGKFTWDGKSPM